MKPQLHFVLPLLALLAGCRAPQQVATAPTVKVAFPADDLGRAIDLKAPAKRIIVIGPGAVETLFAIGAGERIVGRDEYATQPNAAKNIAVAGDYQGPNVEKSVALRPDLIIVQGETYDKGRVENWQLKIGAPVAALTTTTLQGERADILKMGRWTGQSKAAQKVAATLDMAPASRNGPKAFIEIGRAPLYSAGPDTLVGNVVEAAGFTNVAQIKGYQPYNAESLLASPPDVYIVTSDKPRAQIVAELRRSPLLSKLKCVEQGRVLVVDGDLILRPGPRLKQGIEKLQRAREETQNLKALMGMQSVKRKPHAVNSPN